MNYRQRYRTHLSKERVSHLLSYDPDTGIFRWRAEYRDRRPGEVAGVLSESNGYVYIQIDDEPWLAHRLAWLCSHGSWPEKQIDHRDGNPSNNRLSNLREATHGQNLQNQNVYKNNKSGHPGVYWEEGRERWRAQIRVGNRKYNLGSFKEKADAIAARVAAKRDLHPFQPVDRLTVVDPAA